MAKKQIEPLCPKCGSPVRRDRLRKHIRKIHSEGSVKETEIEVALGTGDHRSLVACNTCGQVTTREEFFQGHRCSSRSVRAYSGGAPRNGKRG